ncbi:MAG: hypothetical protein PHP42_04000 [Bacteroidota bacterium]|nr:hypothetical protein [Bacteroidota bacterium]
MITKIVTFIFFFSSVLVAQNVSESDSTLKSIESLYNSGQYVSAELDARRLHEEHGLADSTKVQIEKWIAFSLIAQGKTSLAKERFITLLTIDSNFELDPILTSPKIMTAFNDAKTQYLALRKSSQDSARTTLMLQEQINSVTYRSIVFPGWEQLHTGRTTTGYFFLGAGVASLGAGVTCEVLRAGAKDDYANAVVASDITSKYNLYNRYRKAEIYSFITFAVLYLASEIDVFTPSSTPHVSLQSAGNGKAITAVAFTVPF